MAFINGNTTAGLTSLIFGVDQLERICRAENYVDAEYDKFVEEESKKFINERDSTIKDAKIANIKLQELLKYVFKNRMHKVDLII
jgi:hypothetical protein